ncbi:exodeoxyribonuclease V subunit alpha [soil metagenome]
MIDTDPYDVRLAVRATGLLRDFNRAGVLSAADVHVAGRLGRLGGETDEQVLLAAALAVRGVRLGSVCVHLARVNETVAVDDDAAPETAALAWPEPASWLEACAASALVAVGADAGPNAGQACPLRLVGDLLYLDRYWRQEQLVRSELDARTAHTPLTPDPAALRTALERHFPGDPPDRQRLAAAMAALRSVTVVAGGPGTGKTTTVARLLAVLRSLPVPPPRIALAAPTGKAAARLQEAVLAESSAHDLGLDDVAAGTIHRLLGWRPGSRSRFRHHRDNRLPYDVVVVDETSMVSLTLMSRLLEAVRPEARLVLVGDPDQLASVEAGAVLGDLVARPPAPAARPPARLGEVAAADLDQVDSDLLRGGVVRLTTVHRFGAEIDALAGAVRAERPAEVLAILRGGSEAVSFVEVPDGTPEPGDQPARTLDAVSADVASAAAALTGAARSGAVAEALALLERHRLLCAHRRGPYGVSWWSRQVERWVTAAVDGAGDEGEWYVGRPLLVDANDYELELFNGDTGVVVAQDGRGPVAAFLRGKEPLLVSPTRLSAVQTVHAMTVHRAQGSQFDTVTLVLPPPDSPLLTRELLYTALTRARSHVRVVGTEAAVVRAVRRPIVRASGLRRPAGPGGG